MPLCSGQQTANSKYILSLIFLDTHTKYLDIEIVSKIKEDNKQ